MDNTVLSVENISFSYDKEPFMEGISFNVNKGEFVSIVGANGSGKSTLLNILSGVIKKKGGIVKYKGQDILKIPFAKRAEEIAVIYQNEPVNFPFTVFDIVSMGLYPHKSRFGDISKEDTDFLIKIMEMTDTYKFAKRKITDLSGGEIQRVNIARVLAQKPKLIFLDEAMSALDVYIKIHITDLLKKFAKEQGISVVSVQHDLNLAFLKSDKILMLKEGKMLKYGQPSELLEKGLFKDAFKIDIEIVNDNRFFVV